MTGQTISHYRILEKLGEGGMGVVWKAEDTKLKRTVALKFVPPEAKGDPDLCARFCQEAQAAAALSHPNVCTVFEIDEECGFLAMEFLEGETIQARVRQRPLPIPEALDLAMQAAQGLQAAHEKGIVHRDIKSANLMITPQGAVKIMDFGLARLAGRTRVTRTGAAVGTPAYMSPEQAQGKVVDRRTDLWSLGVVLYEMVSGQLPFRGDSEAAVAHSILHEDPEPVTALRAGLPLELERLIGKALAKDAGERYQHAEDLLVDLRTLRGRLQQESKADRQAAAVAKRRGQLAAAVAGLIIGVAGVAMWNWQKARSAPPPPVVRFSFDLPEGSRIAPAWRDTNVTFSRDSSELFYQVNLPKPLPILARRLDSLVALPLDGTLGVGTPIHSPDGRWLAVTDYQKRLLIKMPRSGGAPIPLVPVTMPFGGAWSSQGYVYWTNSMIGGIVRASENGGKIEPVTQLDLEKEERVHRFVRLLPGEKSIVYTVASGGNESFDDARIDVFDLASKKHTVIAQGGSSPRYSPSGHIVYARGGSLYAVRFDPRNLGTAGPPVKVLDGVMMSTNSGNANYDISPSGHLAYAAGPVESGARTLHWVDRKGNGTQLSLPPRPYLNPRISPDGKLLAFEVEGANHDIYLHDPARGVTTRLTNDGLSHGPVWTPDGKRIAYRSWKEGMMTLYWMPADRSDQGERLMDAVAWQHAVSFSPDGRFLAFDQWDDKVTAPGVWVLPVTGERRPRQLSRGRFSEGAGKFSPDGNWIVYCSLESGQAEVYVQPWPGPGPKIQVSAEGGMDPVWRRNGKEIFYRNGDKMMSASVSTEPTFSVGRPRMLWQAEYMFSLSSSCGIKGVSTTSYDVSLDGERFLMIRDTDQNLYSTRIVVVLNFAEELKRLTTKEKSL